MRHSLKFLVWPSAVALFLTFGGLADAQQAPAPADNKAAVPAPAENKAAAPAVAPPAALDAKPADPVPVDPKAADPSAVDMTGNGDVSLGDIPDVQTEELTPDLAKKAIDGYVMVHDKYQDSPLEDYTDLQAFVDKDPKGKQFEADIKGFGFANVNDWNLAVTSVSVAYNNIIDNQTADIKQQIQDVQKSADMAQDVKDKTIKSLNASLPSENNTKVVQELIKDKAYTDKVKLLETSEE